MKYLAITLSVVLILSGCAKRETVTHEPTGEENILFEEITEDTTNIGDITFTEVEKEPTEEETSIFEEKEPEVETTTPEKRQGYRVQIKAFKNEISAQKEAERARNFLMQDVYVEYIAPHYKLRVGNFLHRSDAEHYRIQVINKGYKGAFIVETTIVVQ